MSFPRNPVINLGRLTEGRIPALSRGAGFHIFDACVVSLEEQGHTSGVELKVTGSFARTFNLVWAGNVTADLRRYWRDEDEATEYGAYGISLLLIEELTDYTVLERTTKGTGFDFWLGHFDESEFPDMRYAARFEVSGIRHGSKQEVSARVRQKMIQTTVSDGQYPAYISVVEFSAPTIQVVMR